MHVTGVSSLYEARTRRRLSQAVLHCHCQPVSDYSRTRRWHMYVVRGHCCVVSFSPVACARLLNVESLKTLQDVVPSVLHTTQFHVYFRFGLFISALTLRKAFKWRNTQHGLSVSVALDGSRYKCQSDHMQGGRKRGVTIRKKPYLISFQGAFHTSAECKVRGHRLFRAVGWD
jgi:hypothetical protein